MKSIISVENLGKRYRIGRREAAYATVRESLMQAVKSPFNRLKRSLGQKSNDPGDSEAHIWALKDVSFDVKPGETVGIIGRNGAGKSTLLKILSRITEPTEGSVSLWGRVASLLEVGTGFHPELTGRENIYLNSAILGMTHREMKKCFDEIVAFADVEKFIDLPVKHYSSGMSVRLAFAVAAHLHPEILLIDEVLAVGDQAFHKKCIGRLEKVTHQGRTVILVSHSMATVRSLCSRAMFLDSGRIVSQGEPSNIIKQYLIDGDTGVAERVVSEAEHFRGVKSIRLMRVRLLNPASNGFAIHWLEPIKLALDFEVTQSVTDICFGFGVRLLEGTWITSVHHDDDHRLPRWDFEPGKYSLQLVLHNHLNPGVYRLHVAAFRGQPKVFELVVNAVDLDVWDHSERGDAWPPHQLGVVAGRATWSAPVALGEEEGPHASCLAQANGTWTSPGYAGKDAHPNGE